MKPRSMDLRDRAMMRLDAGEAVRDVGEAPGVAHSTGVKGSQRRRATGSVAPGKIGGHERVSQKRHPVLSPDTRTIKRSESVWRFCHRRTDSGASTDRSTVRYSGPMLRRFCCQPCAPATVFVGETIPRIVS